MLGQIRRALRSPSQLCLHYQPKADLVTGEVVGAKALVRWQHPTRELLAPAEFIPLAERTGLIAPLTTEVLRTGTRTGPRLERRRIGSADLSQHFHPLPRRESPRTHTTAAPREPRTRSPTRTRNHRKRPHERHRPGHRHPYPAACARRQPFTRRLRYRLLIHGLPQAPSRPRTQNRPVLRYRYDGRLSGHQHCQILRGTRPQPANDRRSRRRRNRCRLGPTHRTRMPPRSGLLPRPPPTPRRALHLDHR